MGGQYFYGVYEESAYGLAQMISSGTAYTASDYQKPILIAHELGHTFGACHDPQASDPIYTGYPFNVPTYARPYNWTSSNITYYTAMTAPFYGDTMSLEFSSSSGHGDSTHNNA